MNEFNRFPVNPDDLLLEVYDRSPERRRTEERFVTNILAAIKKEFGQYIPEDKFELLNDISNSVIFVNPLDFPGVATHFANEDYDNNCGREVNPEEVKLITLIEAGANYYTEVIGNVLGWKKRLSAKNTQSIHVYQKLIGEFGDNIHRFFFGSTHDLDLKSVLEKIDTDDCITSFVYTKQPQNEAEQLHRFYFVLGVNFLQEEIILIKRYSIIEPEPRNLSWWRRILRSPQRYIDAKAQESMIGPTIAHELIHSLQADEFNFILSQNQQ